MYIPNHQLLPLYRQLQQEQTLWLTVAGALSGLLPAAVVYCVLAFMGGFYLWMLLVPAAIIGWVAAYVGRCFDSKPRLLAASIAMLAHVSGVLLLQLSMLCYLLTPLMGAVCYHFAKRSLSSAQRLAISRANTGYLFKTETKQSPPAAPLTERSSHHSAADSQNKDKRSAARPYR